MLIIVKGTSKQSQTNDLTVRYRRIEKQKDGNFG
jgi:hypothetical protein